MKTLRDKLESFDLPFISIATIEECVNAFDKYDKLPQATLDSVQVIADMHDLFFTFAQKRNKMILHGIGRPHIRDVYLFPDNKLEESQKFLKNAPQYLLNPLADNKLVKWEE
jgi:hypothetical protein